MAVAYGIDPAHSGAQIEPGLIPPLEKGWEVALGNAVSYPLIANGRVFVTVPPVSAGYVPALHALDLQTGAPLWGPVGLGTGAKAGAAYEAGRVFTRTSDGNMRAFSAATGLQLWELQIGGAKGTDGGPPTARAGRVYVAADQDNSTTIYALDGASGQILWSFEADGGTDATPIVTESAVYLTLPCNNIFSFEPTTGAVPWHYFDLYCPQPGGISGVVYGERLYAPDANTGVVLNLNTGLDVASFVTTHSMQKARLPAFHAGRGFFVTDGGLAAWALDTLAVEWTFPVPYEDRISTPLVVNDLVYTLSSTGILYALSEADGGVVWSTDTGGPFTAPKYNETGHVHGLAAAEGALIVPAGGRLMAYW